MIEEEAFLWKASFSYDQTYSEGITNNKKCKTQEKMV